MRGLVLLVEDDGVVGALLQLILESEGYEVSLACNGLKALEWLGERHPDLILLDLGMPIMDGVTFMRQLARLHLRPPLPVLVLSAEPDAQAIARRLGAEGCLAKPFDLAELLDEVGRLKAAPSSLPQQPAMRVV